jgi:hypothetical protein
MGVVGAILPIVPGTIDEFIQLRHLRQEGVPFWDAVRLIGSGNGRFDPVNVMSVSSEH